MSALVPSLVLALVVEQVLALVQARVPIRAGDDPGTLAARVQREEHRIYPLAVQACLSGRVRLAGDRAELDETVLPASGAEEAALAR